MKYSLRSVLSLSSLSGSVAATAAAYLSYVPAYGHWIVFTDKQWNILKTYRSNTASLARSETSLTFLLMQKRYMSVLDCT